MSGIEHIGAHTIGDLAPLAVALGQVGEYLEAPDELLAELAHRAGVRGYEMAPVRARYGMKHRKDL